jgi:transposase-like protein
LFSARRYPTDIRSEAVAAVEQRRLRNPGDRTIFREVAAEYGIGEQSLRLWVKKHDVDGRSAAETRSAEGDPIADNTPKTPAQLEAEVKALRKKIEKLQAENDVLKRAFVVFSSEWEK